MNAELSLSPAAIDAMADDIAETAAHLDADGREIPRAAARPPLTEGAYDRLGTVIRQSGIEISAESAETTTPGWDGEAIDYDSCVAALMS